MWHSIFNFAMAHQGLSATVVYFIYSGFCQALPPPDAKSWKFYVFFFKCCHNIAGNWKYAMRIGAPHADHDEDEKEDGNGSCSTSS